MAKSFHFTINDGELEVNHQGEDRLFVLPEWLKEARGLTENEEGLKRWAEENEILLPLMQYGLKELIIALRAVARPSDVKGVKQPWDTQEEGQARIDNWIFKPIPVPGTSGSKSKKETEFEAFLKMARAMQSAGVPEETLRSTLGNATDSVTVARILNEIAED